MTVGLSADTVLMGELFELRVTFPVPAGSIVYFPDTLPPTVNMESADVPRVTAVTAPDGGASVTLAYPMIAFGVGTLPVPGFDIVVAPRREDAGLEPLPGGSVTGRWSDAMARGASAALTRIPRQAVWVMPVFTAQDLAEGVEPMPPDDVMGGDWSWPSLVFVVLFSSAFAITLVATTKTWLARGWARHGHDMAAPEASRARALRRLDELLAEGLHERGRQFDFYTRSSGIVRSYVEGMDAAWAPSLTSSELMGRLGDRAGGSVGDLPREMVAAEAVKFGRLRPDPSVADAHGRALRRWIEDSGRFPW
jgi:hypothetical protein